MSKGKITIVVPVGGEKYLDDYYRLNNNLLYSIDKLFDLNCLQEVIVITNHPDKVEKENRPYLKILKDNEVRESNKYGWGFQQVLKLEVSKYVQTEWYLTMDSDCYFTKPNVNTADFINEDGKAFMRITQNDGNLHDRWNNCALFLDSPVKNLEGCCTVTPVMMNRNYTRDLCDKYDVLEGIIEKKCTEYTLYWTYLSKLNVALKTYINKPITYGQMWGREVKKAKYFPEDNFHGLICDRILCAQFNSIERRETSLFSSAASRKHKLDYKYICGRIKQYIKQNAHLP
tara:strand:- start:285 stop:1145 length:861 start_codon:yes stop_codon:yes gene_type:complete